MTNRREVEVEREVGGEWEKGNGKGRTYESSTMNVTLTHQQNVNKQRHKDATEAKKEQHERHDSGPSLFRREEVRLPPR